MKKLLISILSSTMLLSMVACAETTENPQDVTESTAVASLEATAVSSVETLADQETMVETLDDMESVVETLANQEFAVETLADMGEEISQATLSSGLSAEAAAAYAEVIENIIKKYGDNPTTKNLVNETGLITARVVDFDGDGVEEMYVSYVSKTVEYDDPGPVHCGKYITEEVWAYTDSGAKQVWTEEYDFEYTQYRSNNVTGLLLHNGSYVLVKFMEGITNHPFGDYTFYDYENGTMKQVDYIQVGGSFTTLETYELSWKVNGVKTIEIIPYDDPFRDEYTYNNRVAFGRNNSKYDMNNLEMLGYNSTNLTDSDGQEFYGLFWTYENCLSELKSIAGNTTVSGTPVSGFSDVRSTDWFASYVQYVRENSYGGLMEKGFTSTSFNPYGQATRGMVAEVVTNLFYELGYGIGGHGHGYSSKDNFPDAVGSEFELDIYFCKGSIFAGYPDGTVGVNDPITREAFAVALYAAYGEGGCFEPEYLSGIAPTDTSTLNQFSDKNEISSWATTAVAWAVSNGVMGGSDGAINPQGNLSRAELAVVAKKCHEEFPLDPASGM